MFPLAVKLTLISAGTYLSNVAIVGSIVDTGSGVPSVIATLPFAKLTVEIFVMLPSPKAPPSLKATAVVNSLVPNTLNLMFANTPSAVISSSPIVLSRNTKLILPLVVSILVEKLTAGFTTISPAATDTASS